MLKFTLKRKSSVLNIKSSDVHKALKSVDINKSPVPDCVQPINLKLADDIILSPLTYLFNPSLDTGVIPKIGKSAFAVPLLKGGDPTILDDYRPISKLCVLSKFFRKSY